jgi:CheY-like chemotaxis protein
MRKKILLADDSITIQKVVELTFPRDEFEVATVGNGKLAVEKASAFRPDLVLCDVIMPQMDGYQAVAGIRAIAGLESVPVLFLNGAFEPFDEARAQAVGALGNVSKPFEPPALVARVRDILSKAAQAETAPAPVIEEPEAAESDIGGATEPAPADIGGATEPAPDFDHAATIVEEPVEAVETAEAPSVEASPAPADAEPEGDEEAFAATTIEVPEDSRAMAATQAFDVPVFAPATEPEPVAEAEAEITEEPAAAAASEPEPQAVTAPDPEPVVEAAPEPQVEPELEPELEPMTTPAPPPPAPEAAPVAAAAVAAAPVAVASPAPAIDGVSADVAEQVARRVIEQISERIVREIAWDVIPELAQRLVKAEIERIQAEARKG